MSNQLFIIKHCDGIDRIYTDLLQAKIELKNIYSKIPDYKHYDYQINVYNLIDYEYVISNTIYTYSFDKFTIHII